MNMQLWNPFEEFENLLDRYNKSGGNHFANQHVNSGTENIAKPVQRQRKQGDRSFKFRIG